MENQLKTAASRLSEEDNVLDTTLRPKAWQDYVGQEKVKKNIEVIVEAAKQRNESPEHILFYGGSGLGKTTLSYLIADQIGANIRTTSGPAIERVGDLAALLTNLSEGDILFIDECHRINKLAEEYLYPAMEDYKLSLTIGRGPMARTMDLKLPKFTLIGATTRLASLSAPLRNRFGAIFQLDFYQKEDIEKIIARSAQILNVKILPEAVEVIANCSRFTPRVANRLLKRVRDFAQVGGQAVIAGETAQTALRSLEIDELGLETGDRKILETIIKKFEGGPAGLQALSASSAEEPETILDIYEPYLIQLGFIERTPKGRVATKQAYQHLGLNYKKNQNALI